MFGGGNDDGSGGDDGLIGDDSLSGSSSNGLSGGSSDGGLMPNADSSGGLGDGGGMGGGDDLLGGGDDGMMGGGDGMMGGDEMMGGGDDMMGGDMSFDDMDDDGGGGGDDASSEIEARVEEMENDVGSLSSTVNTVQSENEKISESLEDIEENIRKLLEVYEMVTQGVNPFVEGDSLSDSFDDGSGGAQGTGDFGGNSLFDGDDEDEAPVDEDISAADAEDFLDEDVIADDDFGDNFDDEFDDADDTDDGFGDESGTDDAVGGDENLSFDELKDEYESGSAEWDEDGGQADDSIAAPAGADGDEGADSTTAADVFETDDSTPDQSRSTDSASADSIENAWNDGGRPYLESLPSEYDTEFLVMEWLDYLVEEVGLEGAAETVRFYGSIHWVDDPVEEYLQTMLNGFGGGPDLEDPQPNSSLGIDHRRSLWWISQVASPKKKQLTFGEWVLEEGIPADRLETELDVEEIEKRIADAEVDDDAEAESPVVEAESTDSIEADDTGTELTFVSYIGVGNDDGSSAPASNGWIVDAEPERHPVDVSSTEQSASVDDAEPSIDLAERPATESSEGAESIDEAVVADDGVPADDTVAAAGTVTADDTVADDTVADGDTADAEIVTGDDVAAVAGTAATDEAESGDDVQTAAVGEAETLAASEPAPGETAPDHSSAADRTETDSRSTTQALEWQEGDSTVADSDGVDDGESTDDASIVADPVEPEPAETDAEPTPEEFDWDVTDSANADTSTGETEPAQQDAEWTQADTGPGSDEAAAFDASEDDAEDVSEPNADAVEDETDAPKDDADVPEDDADTPEDDEMDWLDDSDDGDDDPDELWDSSASDSAGENAIWDQAGNSGGQDDGFWAPSDGSGNAPEASDSEGEPRAGNTSDATPQGVDTDGGQTMWDESAESSTTADASWETHRDVMGEERDGVVDEETTEAADE
ncbi:fla cluster protein flaCE [Halostagnicola larsenii XH-48]|uniref:Fla cluster protein flaCE n=1 Tax=Halostagnicola larsenii XH-48 TaxID=797299 RepID=W0JPA3_9EURY|nr:FlaD/FlaE family flagellar protein [Halostagnicola larsenii]AHG00419.1 fla cluster protein flaCE [Halostagnicola larsenii XH-48]